MKKLSFFSFICCLAISLQSCFPPEPDPINPKLLQYTEDGRNLASAIVNEKSVWISKPSYYFFGNNPNYATLTTDPSNKKVILGFFGVIDEEMQSYIYFNIEDLQINHLSDMVLLKGKKVLFDGKKNSITVYLPKSEVTYTINEGQIYFKNILLESNGEIVISGGFGFKSMSATYTYGRFDYRITNQNFIVK